MDLKKVTNISTRDKNLPFGYIRDAQCLFSGSRTQSCNIPEIISYLVALYLHLFEYFECQGPDLELSDDKLTLKCIRYNTLGDNYAYGHFIIRNTLKWREYLWKFKINVASGTLLHKSFVGIALMSTENINDKDGRLYYLFSIGWGARGGSIDCESNDKSCPYFRISNDGDYDELIRDEELILDGDEIALRLDLGNETLGLYINDKQFYEYFKIKMDDSINYKLWVLLQSGRSIAITDFITN